MGKTSQVLDVPNADGAAEAELCAYVLDRLGSGAIAGDQRCRVTGEPVQNEKDQRDGAENDADRRS